MKKLISVFACTLTFISQTTFASVERNDVPSCMQSVDNEYVIDSHERELFVIVDRTMSSSLNTSVMKESYQQIIRFIQPGDRVQIIHFSSLQQDGYTNVSFKGKTDIPLLSSHRAEIKKSHLKKLDQCLQNQKVYFSNHIGKELKESFQPQKATSHSEIVGSLQDISNSILKNATAKRKIVLIISDMLENSEFTSFYASGSVKTIKPTSELKKIIDNKQFSDFNSADIYVKSAGLLPGEKNYVSSHKMSKIEKFWQLYFSKSNGQLRAFGKPMLLDQFK